VEIETLRKLPNRSVRGYAVPPKILLSVHDFDGTPALPRHVDPPAHGEADAVKIAAAAHTVGDSLRLLRLAKHSKNFVAVPMGEAGFPARVLALREGSALAYAAVAEATAPGQIGLAELKHLYRAHQLTRRTRVYGVIGEPIEHSFSPLLHNTGFVARDIDAVYLPFLVHRLRDFLDAVPELAIRGFGVTLPHKESTHTTDSPPNFIGPANHSRPDTANRFLCAAASPKSTNRQFRHGVQKIPQSVHQERQINRINVRGDKAGVVQQRRKRMLDRLPMTP